MKISVILAHPSEKSFNHAVAGASVEVLQKAGHEVLYHDLYREKFTPVLMEAELNRDNDVPKSVASLCREAAESDGFVIVHPNWWGQPPAILKGWVDRVLRQGLAYRFSEKGEVVGLLKARTAVVFNTANTPQDAEDTMYGDPLLNLWKNCIFGFCGVKNVVRLNFTSVVMSTPDTRRLWLSDVRETVARQFP